MEIQRKYPRSARTKFSRLYVGLGLLCFVIHESGLWWNYRGVIQQTWYFIAFQLLLGLSFFISTSSFVIPNLSKSTRTAVTFLRGAIALVLGCTLARCVGFSFATEEFQFEDKLVQIHTRTSGRPPHYGSAQLSSSFSQIEVSNAFAGSHSVGDTVTVQAYRHPWTATFVTSISRPS